MKPENHSRCLSGEAASFNSPVSWSAISSWYVPSVQDLLEPPSSILSTDQIQADHEERHFGLRQVAPTDNDIITTLEYVTLLKYARGLALTEQHCRYSWLGDPVAADVAV